MPKTPLKPSPISVHAQDFWDVSIQASTESEHGYGDILVEREVQPIPDREHCWGVYLEIKLNAVEGEKPPPYTGRIIARGVYEVHPEYPYDAERLIRITGASMLYGAAREMVSTLTARGPNGMLTLPSVSFMEEAPEKKPAKKAAKKAKKKTSKA
jgi:preprotein translocase subunit SecB